MSTSVLGLIRRQHVTCLITALLLLAPALCYADPLGSVFISGHDPDFHGSDGGNALGAQHLIQVALAFGRNGNTNPFLYIQSNTNNNALGDHVDSELGLQFSGFTPGTTPGDHYVKVNATDFATTDLSLYSAIFVPSDHGGSLTGDDLQALNARAIDILSYINAGGGLVAFAEDGFRTPATVGPEPVNFGFLPFLVSSTAHSEVEDGNTLTAFGASIGLTSDDINGNYSHNFFTASGGMTPIDFDSDGQILSLGYRGQLTLTGVVPEPGSIVLLGTVGCLLALRFRKKLG